MFDLDGFLHAPLPFTLPPQALGVDADILDWIADQSILVDKILKQFETGTPSACQIDTCIWIQSALMKTLHECFLRSATPDSYDADSVPGCEAAREQFFETMNSLYNFPGMGPFADLNEIRSYMIQARSLLRELTGLFQQVHHSSQEEPSGLGTSSATSYNLVSPASVTDERVNQELHQNMRFVWVDLRRCQHITDATIRKVAQQCRNLKGLVLLGTAASEATLRVFAKKCHGLTSLILPAGVVSPEVLRLFAYRCSDLLMDLYLVGAMVPNYILAMFATKSRQLKILCLKDCNIDDAELFRLARQTINLRFLDLRGTSASGSTIIEFIKNNPSLSYIEISLTSLNLRHSVATDQHLFTMARISRNLKFLDLTGTAASPATFMEFMYNNPGIESFRISDNLVEALEASGYGRWPHGGRRHQASSVIEGEISGDASNIEEEEIDSDNSEDEVGSYSEGAKRGPAMISGNPGSDDESSQDSKRSCA